MGEKAYFWTWAQQVTSLESKIKQERQRAEAAEARVRELQEAVNAYLSAQNHAGYQDGDERCEQPRSDLCNLVYDLNAADEERHKD